MQNHWTMKYWSWQPTFILRSNVGSHRLIIWKYDVFTSNGLQDIRQNHWTMQYRSQRPTFILRSNIGSHRLIIWKYNVHTSNGLQDLYKTKSLDHEILVMATYIYFEVKHRVTRTHNPKVQCSYIKWSSRYKAKSLDHEIWVMATYIYIAVNLGSHRLMIPKYIHQNSSRYKAKSLDREI